jgi:hypothetical protein
VDVRAEAERPDVDGLVAAVTRARS